MNKKKKNDARKSSKALPEKKPDILSPGDKQSFNTDSHSPSSVLNVGAGYDDTGMGPGTKAAEGNDKKVDSREAKKKSK